MDNLTEYSVGLSKRIHDGLQQWDANRPRSLQRSLGPSSLGACREKLRATVAGDPMEPDTRFNWKAFIGTAVGDLTETALTSTLGAATQERVTTVLPSGIKVSGSTDARLGNELIDFKGKDGLDTVIADGPSLANKIQLACYFIGFVQAGTMDEQGMASLVFQDRSGEQEYPYVWSMTYGQAQSWLEVADDRLRDVQHAIASGQSQGHLRDEDESYCWYTHCPFYKACWPGPDFTPTEEITNDRMVAAIRRYDQGRALAKAAKQLQDEAKDVLGGNSEHPVTGATDAHTLKWTLYEKPGGLVYQRIDLRAKRRQKPAGADLRIRAVVGLDGADEVTSHQSDR